MEAPPPRPEDAGAASWTNDNGEPPPMRSIRHLLLAAPALMSLAACGSTYHGSGQTITIETVPAKSASCLVENARSTWNVAHTPAPVSIERGRLDLSVTCSTPDGWTGKEVVQSRASAVAVTGDVLLASPSAAALDAHTGALWKYPEKVTVHLKPSGDIVDVPDAVARPMSRPAPVVAPRAPSLRAPLVTK